MPTGLQHPDIIDEVAHQAKDDSVVLTIREDTPWDGSDERIVALRSKINTYVAFAVQGQLAKDYPDLAGKPIVICLRCIQHRPDEKAMRFLDEANAKVARHGVQIRLHVIEVAEPQAHQRGGAWWKL
jgi:hypothetical protein